MSQISYSAENLAQLLSKKAVLNAPQQIITHLLTDSRKITEAHSSVFFALEGSRDAHQFIPQLYENGVRCFVITNVDLDVSSYPEANFIWVNQALLAIQKLAALHRRQFNYPVIGITGSNGKTIVKEWLYQLLVPDYEIVRSPKSYNSQLGVPLSVWQMSDSYDLAIFEAGISTIDEMENLANIIQPNIGILTNIGPSHDSGFKDRTQKIQEKLKLFKNADTIILNSQYLTDELKDKDIFSWSFTDTADLKINNVFQSSDYAIISGIFKKEEISIKIPFSNQASIENAVICWATLLSLGIDQDVIASRMEKLLVVKMRLELKSGINQSSIIDDSYNSDFSSLDIALDFLNQQNQHPSKTLILSDIFQSGISADELYKNVAQLIKNKGVNLFIGIGRKLKDHQSYFDKNSFFYTDTNDFLLNFDKSQIKNQTVLIKGARHFEFEKISKVLTQKVHDTVLEINLNAISHNLNHYKAKLLPGVKMMAMVKAFAYGSGSDEVANLLQHSRIDYLAVAYADEGVALRQAGITIPIMVLSPEVSSFETLIHYQLEPEIYCFRILEAFADFINLHKKDQYPIHIKIDTGMHRLGFIETDEEKLSAFLLANTCLKVQSAFSHLVASDSEEHIDYTKVQIASFEKFAQQLQNKLGYKFIKHIANTSAITKWPQAQFDMVRLGIGLYGIESVLEERSSLTNVATLTTSISQIKHLKAGDTVGYGRKGVMQHDGKTATVKIGYADGYPRALGNGIGAMLINGQLAPTIGNVCMDMTMLDVSGLEVKEGDDVIVFGADLSVYEMAEKLNTIPYEVMTSISQRVKRIYFYE